MKPRSNTDYRLLLPAAAWLLLPFVRATAAPEIPTATLIDDPVTVLTPVKPRSEAQQDHLDALAHYATGRVAQQREDNAAALREYQRAARLDPEATAVLREIVPLAFALERPSVAVRYALMAVEKEPTDPVLMRRLAAFVTDEGEQDKALRLYEMAAEVLAAKPEKPNASTVFTAMEMGRLYYLEKQYSKAADRFAEVLKALDKPAEFGLDESLRKAILGGGDITYQLFGEAFFDAARYDDAVTAYEQANAIKPDRPQLALSLARVEFKRGNHDSSMTKLEEYFAARRSDQGRPPYRLLDEILSAQGKSSELLPRLEKLLETDPHNVPLRYFLAEEYRKANRFDKAEPLFQHLLKSVGDRPPVEAYQGLVSILESQTAVEPLLELVGTVAERMGSLVVLGEAGKKLTANGELIAKLLEFANSKLPDHVESVDFGERLAVAELALAAKLFDDADKWFDLAWQIRPDKSAEPMLAWGLELLLRDRNASAAKVFRQVIDEKLLPADNPAAHYYLAGALEMEGMTDDAVAVAREGAAMQKDSPRFASRAGWILYHAKRYDDAQTEYRKLLEAFDGNYASSEVRDVVRDARLVLSNIAVQRNNMAEAEEWLEQVLDEFPDDVGALNDLGYLYADQGKHVERACRMTQEAVAADPKNAAYRDSLGWALFRLGRYPEAVTELTQALALEEQPDGVLYDHLGDALSKVGDTAAARGTYQKAVAAFEKQGETAKAEAVKAKLD